MEPGKGEFLINLQISLVAEYQTKVKFTGYFKLTVLVLFFGVKDR